VGLLFKLRDLHKTSLTYPRINNQLDASNIQNLFCHKTVHISGIFCAHHQELATVHSEIGIFNAGCVTASKQNQVGTGSNLTLLGSVHQNLHETHQCQIYCRKLLMMGREDARNM
jgi:hypothetical protein